MTTESTQHEVNGTGIEVAPIVSEKHSELSDGSASVENPPSEDEPQETIRGPSTGDVSNMLEEMDNGGMTEAHRKFKADMDQRIADLLKELPEGSRPATAEEAKVRVLPPAAMPILIPAGKTIPKELLERCIQVGLFPIPPIGAETWDVIEAEDRKKIIASRAGATEAMRATSERAKQMGNHMMFSGMSHEGMSAKVDMEQFERGPSGLRIPPVEEFNSSTTKQWTEEEFRQDLAMSLNNASFIVAAKWHVAGCSIYAWCIMMTSYLLWGTWPQLQIAAVVYSAALYGYIKFVVKQKAAGYVCPPEYLCVPQEGKIAVVTGGSTGMGAEIVKQLYRMGVAKIFIIEKSFMIALSDLTAAKKELHNEGIDTSDWGSVVETVTCDMSDMNDVSEFTKMLAGKKVPINYLVLNSTEFSDTVPTSETMDQHFMANYLGHFLLAKQLFLPINHANGRVICTSNQFYALARDLDLHNYLLNNTAAHRPVYSFLSSKALRILFTKMLAQRINTLGRKDTATGSVIPSKAQATSFNPGIVIDKTLHKMVSSAQPWLAPIILAALSPISKTPEQAAQTAFKLLFAPQESINSGGHYNEGMYEKTYGACNVSHTEVKNNIVKLWQMSNTMVHEFSFEAMIPRIPVIAQSSQPSSPEIEPAMNVDEE